jgi:hypothetical protein
MEKQLGPARAAVALAQQGQAVMTREDAFELVKTYWPTAPDIEVKKAALMCMRYNLDPGLKQIHLMPFQRKDKNGNVLKDASGKAIIDWSIAIGIRATRINTRRQVDYRYVKDTPRPATDEEQMKYRGHVDKTHLWFITWLQDNKTKEEVFGFGNWPLDAKGVPYKVKGTDKGNTPENMCAIRSERAAADKLCPEWLPPGVKVIDERYMEPPQSEIIPADAVSKMIEVTGTVVNKPPPDAIEESEELFPEDLNDMSTEEIIEASMPTPAPSPAAPPSKIKPRADWDNVTKAQLNNYTALETTLSYLAGMQPKEIYKELGVSSKTDLSSSPWDSFLQIKEVKIPKDAPPG